MWAHDVDTPEYAELLDAIERAAPGRDDRRAMRRWLMLILGIETSCDETAAAVVEDGRVVLLVGRVEPGRPARALRRRRARDREPRARRADHRGDRRGARRGGRRARATLDAVAACHGPGLAGALLVGVSAAKALALAADLPYVGVNHLEAHLYAALARGARPRAAARGAHRVGRPHDGRGRWRTTAGTGCSARPSTTRPARRSTRSRASSASATRAARRSTGSPPTGDPAAVRVPARDAAASRDFSFSGLKTAVVNHVRRAPRRPRSPTSPRRSRRRSSTSSSTKLLAAADDAGAAHARARRRRGRELAAPRARWPRLAEATGRRAFLPPPELCTDNGAMIAATAWWRLRGRRPTPLDAGADPNLAPAGRRRAGPVGKLAGAGAAWYLDVSTRQLRVLTIATAIAPQPWPCRRRHTHMNLQPLEDRIVVRPGEAEETTVSGLVIPDTAKEKPQQGEVLAVGPGRRSEHTGELIPVDVAVGDIVALLEVRRHRDHRRRRGPPRPLEPRRARQGRRREEEVATHSRPRAAGAAASASRGRRRVRPGEPGALGRRCRCAPARSRWPMRGRRVRRAAPTCPTPLPAAPRRSEHAPAAPRCSSALRGGRRGARRAHQAARDDAVAPGRDRVPRRQARPRGRRRPARRRAPRGDEEIGLAPRRGRGRGRARPRSAPSSAQFTITPFVGLLDGRPVLRPDPREVDARLRRRALGAARSDDVYHEERWDALRARRGSMHFFELAGRDGLGRDRADPHRLPRASSPSPDPSGSTPDARRYAGAPGGSPADCSSSTRRSPGGSRDRDRQVRSAGLRVRRHRDRARAGAPATPRTSTSPGSSTRSSSSCRSSPRRWTASSRRATAIEIGQLGGLALPQPRRPLDPLRGPRRRASRRSPSSSPRRPPAGCRRSTPSRSRKS